MMIEQKTKLAKFKCQISAKHKMVLLLIEVLEVSENYNSKSNRKPAKL